ncbi:hypothetical protein BKA69DRAFT_547094 [Paraphysoderma sedebokerense]|nr:hypothetical protein BKA69DRAFT_547094 [Paraphysoderma sedebokerense]
MGLFVNYDLVFSNAIDKLNAEIERNPHYPFLLDRNGCYTMSIRYRLLYAAIVAFIVSLGFLVAWTTGNFVQNNNFFLFPLFGIIISLAGIYNYRAQRIYTLYPKLLEYSLSHDNKLHVSGNYHNVYIRLRREIRGGSRSKFYHLIFNGYQIDGIQISESTKNVEELRKLGQLIAERLDLNYFDEQNSSEHHVIRHLRPTKPKK